MGWVKEEIISSDQLYNELVSALTRSAILIGVRKSFSGSVYEYLTDLIKDNYDVTLTQCHAVSVKVAEHFGIEKIFAD